MTRRDYQREGDARSDQMMYEREFKPEFLRQATEGRFNARSLFYQIRDLGTPRSKKTREQAAKLRRMLRRVEKDPDFPQDIRFAIECALDPSVTELPRLQ